MTKSSVYNKSFIGRIASSEGILDSPELWLLLSLGSLASELASLRECHAEGALRSGMTVSSIRNFGFHVHAKA